MSVITLKSNELTVKIKSFGAELTSITDTTGKEFLWQGNPEVWEGQAPILFPMVSRLREGKYKLNGKEYSMGLHGFAKQMEFEVENVCDTSAVFLLKSNDETRVQYPFDFEFRVIYTLDGRKLRVDFRTDNKTEVDMYYSTGAHEAYACPGGVDNYTIIFDENETLSRYEILPEGGVGETPIPILSNEREIKLDYSYFAVDALIFLDAKSRGIALRDDRTGEKIHVDFSGFDTLLIWTRPGGEYVCIEPWSGSPELPWKKYDDLSEKYRIRTLGAGKSETLTHTITF